MSGLEDRVGGRLRGGRPPVLIKSVVLVRKNEWSFPKTYLCHGDRRFRVDRSSFVIVERRRKLSVQP